MKVQEYIRLMNFYNSRFVKFVENQCIEHDVKFIFNKDLKKIKHGETTIVGYFSQDVPELVVAANNHKYISVLLHEYCHMLQWIDNPDDYERLYYGYLYEWIEGSVHDCTKAKQSYEKYCTLERDVAFRGLPLIKKFGLRLDPDRWIQSHNAELTWFAMSLEHRNWGLKYKGPCYPTNLVKMMPKHLNYLPEDKIPKKFSECLLKYFT